jgi:hypothetical protein
MSRRRVVALWCVATTLGVLIAAHGVASAKTVYAGPGTGTKTGTCTELTIVPCSLSYALTKIVAGDALVLAPGTNVRQAVINLPGDVTVTGAVSGNRPLLTGAVANGPLIVSYSGGLTLRQLHVRNTAPDGVAASIGNSAMGEQLVLEATGASGTGVYVAGLLRDSIVRVNGASAVAVRAGGSTAAPGRLRNVTAIAEGGGTGVRVAGFLGGAAGYFDEHADVRNSIVRGTPALLAQAAGGDASGAGTITLARSDVPVAGRTTAGGAFAKITDLGGNLDGGALLTDVAAGDLRPLAASPTIDAGALDAFTGAKDVGGAPRVTGAAVDIGAHEYVPPPAGTTTPGPGGPGAPSGGGLPSGQLVGQAVLPVLGRLTLGVRRFRAASRGATVAAAPRAPVGTLVVYDASVAALATIGIERVRRGVLLGGRCRAQQRRGPRGRACTRFVRVGSAQRAGVAGTNRLRLTGRVAKRKLRPGSYRLVITARVGDGPVSQPLAARFAIVR